MTFDECVRALGIRLFRWRSWTFVLPAAIMLLFWNDYDYPVAGRAGSGLFELFCLLVAAAGIAVRVMTIGHIADGTSGRNTTSHKAAAINTTGLYSIMRNPLYLGNYLIFLGMSLLSQSWEVLAINTLLFAAAYVPIILAEEHFLLQKFGLAYQGYVSHVPRFLPRLWLWRKPDRPLSWRMILRRENDSLFSTVLAFLLIELVRQYTITGRVGLDVSWIIMGSVVAAVWVVLKALKRCTNLLKPRADGVARVAPALQYPRRAALQGQNV